MKCINIAPNFFKKIILFLLISLSLSNVSAYSHILSPINIEDTSMDDNCEKNNVDKEKKIVYLTFDDGPSKNTELILDILKENNVHATFFMVAQNAQKNPEIVKFLQKKGHKIGLHSWQHKNAMLYSYFYTKKDFENSISIMKKLGVEDLFYRPPWGHTNIFSLNFVKKYNMKLIYWDVMAEDWSSKSTPDMIYEKLMQRTS